MTNEPGATRDEFRLEPNEDFLFGVSLERGTLRFGPPGAVLLWTAVVSVVGLIIAAATLIIPFDSFNLLFWEAPPAVGRVIAVGIVCAVLTSLVVHLRAGTRADPEGVIVRSSLRSRRYDWATIVGTRIVETKPVAPFRMIIGDHGGAIRADVDSSKAYLVLDDSSQVHLRSFDAAARAPGARSAVATPTEVKVAALRRYRETVFGPWPTDRRPPP